MLLSFIAVYRHPQLERKGKFLFGLCRSVTKEKSFRAIGELNERCKSAFL